LTKSRANAIFGIVLKRGTAMKSLKILLAVTMIAGVAMPDLAFAKAKASHSAAQRKAAYEQGLKYCRKKYGERLHSVVVEQNYGKWGAWCYTY
jgi:hypothetical protein